MKYLFFIQNEGRGHLTQSLTIASKLRAEGHEIVGAIMNKNPYRELPSFFKEQIACPIYFIKSPYFLKNKDNTGISMPKSVVFNLLRSGQYLQSLFQIKKILKESQPDTILNFYEPLAGLYYLLFRPKIISYCLGHQFFLEHPSFKRPSGRFSDHVLLKFYNKLVAYGTKYKFALSFTQEKDCLKKRIIVCPPLIREEIKSLKVEDKDFILSYLLNDGYFLQVIEWANKNRDQKIEAFWDKKDEIAVRSFSPKLNFHPISGQLFLDFLKDCSTYVSTAGFESICEASYLGKKILMIPTVGHYEQLCNAVDAKRAGLAESATSFNIDIILNKKDNYDEAQLSFRKWVDSYEQKIIKIISANN